jgi:hypothetical protein
MIDHLLPPSMRRRDGFDEIVVYAMDSGSPATSDERVVASDGVVDVALQNRPLFTAFRLRARAS